MSSWELPRIGRAVPEASPSGPDLPVTVLAAVVAAGLLVVLEVTLRLGWVPNQDLTLYRAAALAAGAALLGRRWPLPVLVVCGPVYCCLLVSRTDVLQFGGLVLPAPVVLAAYVCAAAAARARWVMALLALSVVVLVVGPVLVGQATAVRDYERMSAGRDLATMQRLGVVEPPSLLSRFRNDLQGRPVGVVRAAVQIFPVGAAVTLTALAGGAFLLGRASRRQRDLLGTLQERNAELEVLRREDAARAALTERTRIARELHDVVAHHMTAIVVRAQAAVRVGTARQEDPTATLTWIAETGQESLRATRQAIRMLRTTTGEAVPLAPEPTLRDLEDVARRLRDAGLAVDLHLPDAAPLPDPAVEAAVVRIVTEALTNVLRHAAASRAVVRVVVRPEVVEVLVEDDGTTAPPAGGLPATAGHGLAGMRERALALGGDCSPGRGSLGGWAVTARIPCAAEPAAGGAR